jgi:hypothetical protein
MPETMVAANEQLNFALKSRSMCKSSYVLAVLALFCSQVFAQVGIGTSSPHGSAALDISATSKGLLVPRLTTTQRSSISDPQPGLIIYNTTDSKFQGYAVSATPWLNTDPNNGSYSTAGWGGDEYVAQSFVATSSEAIYRVGARALTLDANSQISSSLVEAYLFEGQFDPNASPSQTVLANSLSVTISSLGEYNFDFTSSYVPTIGSTYSIVFRNYSLPSDRFICTQWTSSTYSGGNQYFPASGTQSLNSDLDIRIYTGGTWTDLH